MGKPIKIDNYSIYSKEGNGGCQYYIRLKDDTGKETDLAISESVYQTFLESKRQEKHFRNEYDRRIAHVEFNEEILFDRMFEKPDSTADTFFSDELSQRLQEVLHSLPELQRRRFLLYYEEGLTYGKIAEMEGCTIMPVKRSIDRAKEKMENFLK